MSKHNTITASIGNPYIRDESEQDKHSVLQAWLDSYTTNFEVHLGKEKLVLRYNGQRKFSYPKNITLDWIKSKVEYMVLNNI